MKYVTKAEGSLFRIIADEDFELITGDMVKKGDLGGLVDSEDDCLSQLGKCWIDKYSKVANGCVTDDSVLVCSEIKNTGVIGESIVLNCNIKNAIIENSKLQNTSVARCEDDSKTITFRESVFINSRIDKCYPTFQNAYVNDSIILAENFYNNAIISGLKIPKHSDVSEGTFFTIDYLMQNYIGKDMHFDIRNISISEDNPALIQQKSGHEECHRNTHQFKSIGELSVFTLPLFAATGHLFKDLPYEYAYGSHKDKTYVEVRGENTTLFLEGGKDGEIGFLGIDSNTYSEISTWDLFEDDITSDFKAEMFAFGRSLLLISLLDSLKTQYFKESLSSGVEAILRGETLSDDEANTFNDCANSILQDIVINNRPIVSLNQMNLPKSINVICGTFETIEGESKTVETAKDLASGIDELKKKFCLFPERKYTEEEKKLIPEIPSYIKVDKLTLEIAELVKKSFARPHHLRKTNILFEGPKGTGKTQRVSTLSGLWGVPRVSLCCSSNMTEDTLIGGILPNLPDSSMEEKLDTAVSFYETKEGMERPEFVFVASQLALALEHGWVCEIQEPTCINDAGVLIALNSILEKDGQLQLPNRIIKRHPDAIVIITTNRDYEGCRPLNQALRDRMDWSVAAELPSDNDLIERIMTYTGCDNEPFIQKTVDAVNVLNEQLVIMGINNSVSQRGLNNFVADMMDGISVERCIDGCLLNSITTDPEELAELKQALMNSTNIYDLSL